MTISQSRNLLIDVPHGSPFIPNDVWREFLVPKDQVEGEALASADLYTGEMARQAWPPQSDTCRRLFWARPGNLGRKG